MLRLLGHGGAAGGGGGGSDPLGSRGHQLQRGFELEVVGIAAEVVGPGSLELRCGGGGGRGAVPAAVRIDHGCGGLGVHGADSIVVDATMVRPTGAAVAAVAVAALAAAAAHRIGVAAAATTLRARTLQRLEDGRGGVVLLHGRRRNGGWSRKNAAQWRRWGASHIHIATTAGRSTSHFRRGHVILHVGHGVTTFRHICGRETSREEGRKQGEKVSLVRGIATKIYLH